MAALAAACLAMQGQLLVCLLCQGLTLLSGAGFCGHQSGDKEDVLRYHPFVRALTLTASFVVP